ncbi:hypothetical protein MRB53_031625 [Persea americana]|uniref:Uncharacterized protein n=1 Tax=Persea americana TaxID=3435 RepID=A0ACC2KPI5_PERAE|nr:hypothetical protein MRB53_031625 [Persea americana]
MKIRACIYLESFNEEVGCVSSNRVQNARKRERNRRKPERKREREREKSCFPWFLKSLPRIFLNFLQQP